MTYHPKLKIYWKKFNINLSRVSDVVVLAAIISIVIGRERAVYFNHVDTTGGNIADFAAVAIVGHVKVAGSGDNVVVVHVLAIVDVAMVADAIVKGER